MPPRKTARVVSGPSAPPPPAAPRVSRARKASVAPTAPSDEEDGGFPGDSDDDAEEEVIKPTSKRAAPTSKPAGSRAPRRIVSDEEEEEVVKPASKRAAPKAKPPAVPAKRKSARISMASAAEESSVADEEEVRDEAVKPRSRKASGGRAKKVLKQEPVDEAEEAAEEVNAEGSVPVPVEAAPAASPSAEEASAEDPAPAPVEAEPAILPPSMNEIPLPSTSHPPPAIVTDEEDEESDYEEADATVRLDSAPNLLATPLPSSLHPPTTPSRLAPPSTPFGDKTPTASRSHTAAPSPGPVPPPPGPKPRLTIHKIVLINFKSYAGRQEIGPFHKSFSAIVGPNGSGKSNTIDALLFVFGYRASKMRQGKLSELIHNSAGKEGLESCSVEVWFREIVDLPGVDNFLLVPNSQLVVNRTAYRNNSSRYTINERTSTFTEVTTLLKAKGIDLDHNRFLILQGEVESIALMKPKAMTEHEDGLLEYLEDIIGTTKYKQPIEEAEQEVEKLNEDKGEKMSRLKVVERERAALEDKKQEAEDFLRDSNELTRKKSLLWQHHMQTLNNNVDITTKAIEALGAELADEQDRNAHHLAEITELQQAYDDKLAAFEEVKKFADQLVKDSKKFEKEEVGLSEKKKHLGTRVKKVKKSLTDDGHARSEALSTIENCASELEKNRKKVTDLETKLEAEEAELEEVRDSLKGKTDHFTTQIETKQRELEPWTAKISEKQSAIDVATSERDLLAQKATAALTALEEAKANLEKIKAGDGSKQEEYERLKGEKKKAQAALKEKEQSLEGMSAKAEQLRAKVSSSRSKTDEAKASLQADKSENAVLSSLNKLKAQGRIKGFHGRLGDLGVIDDKYDVAVTTACSALNNLVVDTVEQGQACIEHLRKGNVGRASFMVLEKLPPRDLNAIETPENVPRLFDLIKPKDPRFAPAFYKGLFNTLVADDLVQAQRIGYGKKRWRVVTLAGQLIDPSGTMSGGGSRVSRGGMSSKFTADRVEPEVVARLEKELGQAEAELAVLIAERKALALDVAKLQKRVPEIEMEMEKIELDVKTGEKRIAEGEKRLAELQSQSKPDAADEKRISSLSTEIAQLTKETDKLRSQSSSISEEIKDLQEKILQAGGVKLRAIQSKVATTKGLLDLASEAITKAEVAQAKSERDADKLGKAIEKNKAALEEVEAELEGVQGELDAVQKDLAIIRGKVQEAAEACADVQEGLGESKKELDVKTGDINAFRKLEMDIKQKIEDNQKIQKDSRDKHKHWRKRHDELELAYIDEDDEDEEDEAAAKPAEGADDVQPADGEDAEPVEQPARKKKRKHDSFELVEYSPDELAGVDKEMLNAEITQLEEEIGKAKPNLTVLAEYRKRDAEFLSRAQEHDDVTAARDAAKVRLDELSDTRLKEFMAGFTAISTKLKEMYQMITMGGNAEIECIDTSNPFSEGVVLSIMPPKKSWRQIANLSGGEKTLASLALVFALHVFKPTPLYFMDEIDAALDFKNVSIVANYIQSKTQAAQFIVISLRNDMFELAHRLVGIYKTSNCTKSIAIDNKDLRTQAVPRRIGPPGRSPSKSQAAGRGQSPDKRGASAVPGTPMPGGLSAGGGMGLMVPSTPRAGSVVPSTPGTVRG